MSGLFYKRRLSDIRLNLANIMWKNYGNEDENMNRDPQRGALENEILPIIYSYFLTFAT